MESGNGFLAPYMDPMFGFFEFLMIAAGILWYLWMLWEFVDDHEKRTNWFLALFAPVGFVIILLCLQMFVAWIWYVFDVWVAAIPWEAWAIGIGFFAILFSARWIRRLHKAVHKHVNDKGAHKTKMSQEPKEILERPCASVRPIELYATAEEMRRYMKKHF